MAYDFYKNHICFFLSVLIKKQTHCTHIVHSVSYLNLGRAELTNAHRGDWTSLNFAYAVIIEERIKK